MFAAKGTKVAVGKLPGDNSLSEPSLFFKISAGLKRIIGRDLITNDFVAIFELVKNSFDARATRVDIHFSSNQIFIADNGKGMSYDDLVNKWLFVAYSAKKDGTEDAIAEVNYRDQIDAHRPYAGSKGVGRFSCDRLGRTLRLQSKSSGSVGPVHVLSVDWDEFETDNKAEFVDVGVGHHTQNEFTLPEDTHSLTHGTVLSIGSPREDWPRKKLLELKRALAKLINPFADTHDNFEIYIHAPHEVSEDVAIAARNDETEEGDETDSYQDMVNGKIGNFIFETLNAKTTNLDVRISDDGTRIISVLKDRGELIYEISETNIYEELVSADFSCNLYYLNKSAKSTFKRRMGVASVEFGAVFLFRNGFRVYPVGESGDDTFEIDRRKQQGYARYLGTRDILGRIDVKGTEDSFRESTSRDQGLIETPAYIALKKCFWEKCLKRLENYVVGVTWMDALDSMQEDASRLAGDKARARIIELVSKLSNGSDIELISYNHNLVGILNEKSEDFEQSLESLRLVAEKTQDPELEIQINKAETRYRELKQAEQLARVQADKERKARQEAEGRAQSAEQAQKDAESQRERAEKAYEEEKKRNLFLTAVTSLDYDNIVNLHHQIGIYSADILHLIANQIDKLQHKERIDDEDLLSLLEQLSFKNQKILSVSRFATKANFRMDSELISEDLVNFIKQYIDEVCSYYSGDGLKLEVNAAGNVLVREFKPIEISMIIDNLVNNAEKAGATKVSFDIEQSSSKIISILVKDDGNGLDPDITERDRIFEKGFSTTDGSGLGLYHIAYILDQMGGGIELQSSGPEGTEFIIRIKE
jgi:signal transduction histidine kinase